MIQLFKSIFVGVLLAATGNGAAFGADSTPPVPKNPQRIVSVGGGVTETIYALGAEAALVAVDTSSTYPEAATKLPKCGYQRTLSAEGVASLKPDLIFLAGAAGPPTAIEQLGVLGIPNVRFSEEHSVEAAKAQILKIGTVLGREEKALELVRNIDQKMASLPTPSGARPKVIFVLSAAGSKLLVSGRGTAADAMIRLAGGENAADSFESYKPVSAEALAAMAPDAVLTTTRTQAQIADAGLEAALPGIGLTPAGKAHRVIVMDDLYLLGFGPRVGDAVADLAAQLHGTAASPGTLPSQAGQNGQPKQAGQVGQVGQAGQAAQ